MRRLSLAAFAAAAIVAAGCGSGSHSPVRPRPAVATNLGTNDCRPTAGDGSMGACNPQRSEPTSLTGARPFATLGGIQGVDLSNNNGTVSFSYLAAHGIRFVYAKAEQQCFTDSELAHNAAGAAAVHIRFGVYDFIQPGLISPAADAACLAARERLVLRFTHQTLPVVFDAESFNGLSGFAICVWLHAAENDLRVDLPGVLIGVYGSPGTYPGCSSNGGHAWPADWLVSFPVNLAGFSGFYNWQWFGPRFASTTLEGMDRDKGSPGILSLLFPKAKPSRAQLHAALRTAFRRRELERAFLEHHHCRQPPWHVAVGLSGRSNGHYEHACHVELRHGAATNAHIRQLRREGAR